MLDDESLSYGQVQAKHLMHCWSKQKDYNPIEVERTEGCWIYTKDGRKIFDLRSAHETNNIGFNHPRVIAKMKEQMEKVIHVTDDFSTQPTAELAQKLAHMTPGSPNKKVWFGQSGAAALECAVKAARYYRYNEMMKNGIKWLDASSQYPMPYKIISRYRSWHGATNAASALSGDPRRWFAEPYTMPGVVFAPDAYSYRPMIEGLSEDETGQVAADYMEKIIEHEGGSGHIAAVLIEPIVGSNGIIPPPKGYVQRVAEICEKWGLVLIVDETMTCLGRTGKFFSFEHYGIEPDIIVMAQSMGHFCPISATIFSERISKSFEDNIFGHGQSFSGHALASAAALESIKVVEEEGILEHVTKMGNYLGNALRKMANSHPSVGDVRGQGLYWTVELVKNPVTKEPLRKYTQKYDKTIVTEIAKFLLEEKNIYIPSDKFGIWVVPPLVINQEEVDFIIQAIDEALNLADMNSWRSKHASAMIG